MPAESIEFRRLQLPPGISGELYLHSLPGRREAWQAARQAFEDYNLDGVICLETTAGIQRKSPQYARAIDEDDTGVPVEQFPIPDFSIPVDTDAFLGFVEASAGRLREGHRLLVHCGAGIGRTGTFAAAVLLQMGLSLDESLARVRKAGSHPETPDQHALLANLAQQERS